MSVTVKSEETRKQLKGDRRTREMMKNKTKNNLLVYYFFFFSFCHKRSRCPVIRLLSLGFHPPTKKKLCVNIVEHFYEIKAYLFA